MRKQPNPLTDKQWIPLIEDGEQSKPFDQTNGVATASDDVEHDGSNDALTLFEKGAASSIITF